MLRKLFDLYISDGCQVTIAYGPKFVWDVTSTDTKLWKVPTYAF